MANKAVFFDRDGTLIADPGYLSDPDDVRLMPGAAESVRRLREAGFRIVIVTNQSGIARGLFDEPTLERIHQRVRGLFAAEAATIDAIYYCPYLDGPAATIERYRRDSELRKPRPGMFLQAAAEHDIDLDASWAVGDSDRDSEAGKAAGCRTIQLVTTVAGHGATPADAVATTLRDATDRILAQTASGSDGALDGGTRSAGTSDRSARAIEEIAEHVRLWQRQRSMEDFTLAKLVGVIAQLAALGFAIWAAIAMVDPQPDVFPAHRWLAAIFFQLAALTAFILHR
ncbi:MAG: HAD family hydrolase [Phycisphaerae bacterium]|nr:HAD family hydrolase [Phycisphaerae bacterium]